MKDKEITFQEFELIDILEGLELYQDKLLALDKENINDDYYYNKSCRLQDMIDKIEKVLKVA